MTAAAAFECEPNEVEFHKLFSEVVRVEATAPGARRNRSEVAGAQPAAGGSFASSPPLDLGRRPAFGAR